ncbi:hypothetical protein ACHAWT_005408, partial [Skeletonema menzelii]
IFTAVTQLNIAGPEAVEDERQYAIVANHNLRAGKKAMEMSDFEAAYSYFDNGITFLRKKHWEEHYALSLEMFDLAAKCALANGDFISMMSAESLEKVLDILSRLGIELRGRESSVAVCVKETKDLLSTYTYDELLNIRRMTDSTMIMAMKFLSKLMVGMTEIMPKSAPHVSQQIIRLSLTHGMSHVSPLGFVHLGSYIAKLGDIRGGYKYVKLARSLLDKLGSRENAAGDISQAVLNIYFGYISVYYAGVKLQTTREKGDEVVKFMQERRVVTLLLPTQCIQNSVLKLIGIEEESKNVSTEEESTLATNKNVTTTHCFQKLYISFLFRLYDETKVNAEEFLDCIASSNWAMLIFAHSFQSFCIGLISFWVARSSRRDGEQWYEIGNKSKLALRKLAETSRWTFENKWYLLEAETKKHWPGAIGKCTSLFKFFDSIMNRCVDSSPADSLAIVNDVQSELARLSEDSIRNAEVRKRRVDEDDHSFGGAEPVQAGSSPDEVVKTLD